MSLSFAVFGYWQEVRDHFGEFFAILLFLRESSLKKGAGAIYRYETLSWIIQQRRFLF